MGNRGSRPQDEQPAPPQNNRPPNVYAQYPPAPPSRPPQTPPYYPTPPSNGQYYGGWHAQGPTYPYPPQHPSMNRPYPHAPPPPNRIPSTHPRPQQSQRPIPPAPTQELTQTATIRNAVNLKKNTLAVTPFDDDPNRLAITFNFDASAPCIVTTFVLATEDTVNGCKLTTAIQPPGPPLRYDKGLGLRFPPSTTSSSSSNNQHCIHLDLHETSALTTAEKDTYPVAIRLEVISEKGTKSGHSLDELTTPGDEQKEWIQSQTTFARLVKEDDDTWRIRVIKQKIWVEGVSYELQEIYGLEQASAAAGSSSGGTTSGGNNNAGTSTANGASTQTGGDESEERLCVICLVNLRDTTVLPCRHMCMCHECAKELRKQSSKCPICRNHVESLLHIRIAKENNSNGGEKEKDKEKDGVEVSEQQQQQQQVVTAASS